MTSTESSPRRLVTTSPAAPSQSPRSSRSRTSVAAGLKLGRADEQLNAAAHVLERHEHQLAVAADAGHPAGHPRLGSRSGCRAPGRRSGRAARPPCRCGRSASGRGRCRANAARRAWPGARRPARRRWTGSRSSASTSTSSNTAQGAGGTGNSAWRAYRRTDAVGTGASAQRWSSGPLIRRLGGSSPRGARDGAVREAGDSPRACPLAYVITGGAHTLMSTTPGRHDGQAEHGHGQGGHARAQLLAEELDPERDRGQRVHDEQSGLRRRSGPAVKAAPTSMVPARRWPPRRRAASARAARPSPTATTDQWRP